MIAAVEESIVEFDLDVSLFVDEKASFQEGQAAQPKLVAAINASTPDSRLWIVVADPCSQSTAPAGGRSHGARPCEPRLALHTQQHPCGTASCRCELGEVKRLVIENGAASTSAAERATDASFPP
jgi:hypothetical protein